MNDLKQCLETIIADFSGKVGFAAEHLETGDRIAIDEDMQCATASMIKIPILVELYHQRDEGKLALDDEIVLTDDDKIGGSGLLSDLTSGRTYILKDFAVLMMSISDNTATNLLINHLGIEAINQTIRNIGMAQTELRRIIDFDLLKDDNDAFAVSTASDFVLLMKKLYKKEILRPETCAEVIEIMRIQKYIERLNRYLPFSPYDRELGREEKLWVASKTGALTGVRTEAGLVVTANNAWALCVMSKDSTDKKWNSDFDGNIIISRISKALYDYWEGERS